MTKAYTRADDEKLLRALRLRDRGHTIASIARAVGMTKDALAWQFYRCDHDSKLKAVCAVDGCGVVLSKENVSGVCRKHNHHRRAA